MPRTLKRLCSLLVLFVILVLISFPAQHGDVWAFEEGYSLPDAVEAIQQAQNTTRVLYVIAHPDDEGGSVGLLAYLSRHLGADVALLSITRGEGGQNAIGPEQGAKLAVLRTAELEAATRAYGTRLFFTRAPDFGYSKSPEETLRVWGTQAVEDMKHVFRTFRPHFIVNNWGGVRGGHGHHVAAGLLVPRVLDELRQEGDTFWKRVVLLDVSRGSGSSSGVPIPSDIISPLRGKSYNEIGLEGFIQHRTQGIAGFRRSPFFRSVRTLTPEPGRTIHAEDFQRPLAELVTAVPQLRVELEQADLALASAHAAALRLDWSASIRWLAAAGKTVERAARELSEQAPELREALEELKQAERKIQRALVLASALRLDASADRSEVVQGESFTVHLNWQWRETPGQLVAATLVLPEGWRFTSEDTQTNSARFTVVIPGDAKLPEQPDAWMYPWPEPLVKARVEMEFEGYRFAAETPVVHDRVTSTRTEVLPLRLVPAVTLVVEPRQFILPAAKLPARLTVLVRVRQHAVSSGEVTVGLNAPPGWQVPAPVKLNFAGPGDHLVRFAIEPALHPAAGSYMLEAWAERAGERFATSLEPLPSLPAYFWPENASARVSVLDLAVPAGLHIGYIAAANDPLPEAIRQLGIEVSLLDEVALAFGELSQFDAITVGIRAYELRDDLARANQRLLEYVQAGGTLVVQYQRESTWQQLHPAPYPAEVGASDGNVSGRVTDENSPVRFLLPDHPLLNFPNRIRPADFEGWVQERGLYFWGRFDARYQAPLALRDPGEAETTGSLVYARYGKGVYIYTGLSFFRQLPEGVPGAYRLFVNLLSQSKAPPP